MDEEDDDDDTDPPVEVPERSLAVGQDDVEAQEEVGGGLQGTLPEQQDGGDNLSDQCDLTALGCHGMSPCDQCGHGAHSRTWLDSHMVLHLHLWSWVEECPDLLDSHHQGKGH